MFTLLTILHVLFCLFLILVILLQTGKGAGIGAAFGGGSQTVFGPRGAGSFIGKLTGGVAAAFMVTSLVLAYLSSSGATGIARKANALNEERAKHVEDVDVGQKAAAPAKPEDAGAEVDAAQVDAETTAPEPTAEPASPAKKEAKDAPAKPIKAVKPIKTAP